MGTINQLLGRPGVSTRTRCAKVLIEGDIKLLGLECLILHCGLVERGSLLVAVEQPNHITAGNTIFGGSSISSINCYSCGRDVTLSGLILVPDSASGKACPARHI